MKVVCNRESLREGLAIANNVVPSKSTKPIVTNVLFSASAEGVELLGTDLDVSIRYRIPPAGDAERPSVKVIEPGVVALPARVLHDFVRDLGGEEVELTHTDGNCQVKCGGDSCELVVADAAEFPEVPRFEDKGSIAVQAGTFTTLATRTAFAAAREQGRYAMHGVLIEVGDGVLKLVATDGRRLAVAHAPIDASPRATTRPTIVPTKGMQLFCRGMVDPLENVHLQLGENQMGLKTGTAEIFARLLDGEFPRYSAVIPTEAQHVVEADAEQLERKIRLVANVTGDEARAVRFSVRSGHMEIFGSSAGRGEARAHLDLDYRGAAAEVAFNPDYVIDGLKNCETGRVRLEFNEKTAPGKFWLGENYVYVVMPITLDS